MRTIRLPPGRFRRSASGDCLATSLWLLAGPWWLVAGWASTITHDGFFQGRLCLLAAPRNCC
jgi:hypothetical protein